MIVINPSESRGPLVEPFKQGQPFPCFLGISPTSPYVNWKRLRAILFWLAPRTSQIVVVEGTYPNRWNLMGLRGLSQTAAIASVEPEGARIRRRIARIALELPNTAITPLDWREELESADYRLVSESIREFANSESLFCEMARKTVARYLLAVHRIQAGVLREDAYDCVMSYVIEEVAMFIHLYRRGFEIEVYPGSDLPIMLEISRGRFKNFPFPCPMRTHISLEIKHA